MKRRVILHVGLFAVLITVVSGCGDKITTVPPAPTGPTTLTTLLLPRVDGLWGGPYTLIDIAGGTGPAKNAGALDCLGVSFNTRIGETNDHTLSITQTGTNVTARLASAGTGLSCLYTGRITSNSLLLTASTCDAPTLDFMCQDGGRRRLTIVGSTITATTNAPVNVTAISGTAAHTYNWLDTHSPPDVGALVANHEFTSFTRR